MTDDELKKLSDGERRHLLWLEDWLDGLEFEQIAEKHGVGVQAVYKAARRHRWHRFKKSAMEDAMQRIAVAARVRNKRLPASIRLVPGGHESSHEVSLPIRAKRFGCEPIGKDVRVSAREESGRLILTYVRFVPGPPPV